MGKRQNKRKLAPKRKRGAVRKATKVRVTKAEGREEMGLGDRPIGDLPRPDNMLPGELEGLTQEEIDNHKGTLKAILVAVREAIEAEREKIGQMSCEDLAKIVAAALPAVGRLADDLIADIKD